MMRGKCSLFRHESEGTEGVQDGELKKNQHVGNWEGVESGCHLQENDWNLNLKRRLLRVLSDSICDFCLH
jgi:hypothetical protein